MRCRYDVVVRRDNLPTQRALGLSSNDESHKSNGRTMTANDPSSATRRTGRNDCNRDALAGLDAMMG
jgi:hypothetical protein